MKGKHIRRACGNKNGWGEMGGVTLVSIGGDRSYLGSSALSEKRSTFEGSNC